MKTILFVGVPLGVAFACRNVTRVSQSSNPFRDLYAIELSKEEASLLAKASAEGLRQPIQLFASAFFRSLPFGLERLVLLVVTRTWNSNSELFSSSWEKQNVAGIFNVIEKGPENVALSFSFDSGATIGGISRLAVKGSRLEFGSELSKGVDPGAVPSFFHGLYSRMLLAGAKFKLMRDAQHVVEAAANRKT